MSELTILGSGTGSPSLRRGAPGLLLVSGGVHVLIDSGSGTLGRMLEAGVTYRDLDLLLYTHVHPDHISDLVPILFACKYGEPPRREELTCLGGPGFNFHFEKLKGIYGPWIESETYPLTIGELSSAPVLFKGIRIQARPVVHLPESVCFRIEFNDGKSVVISGDTGYNEKIISFAQGSDLLVLECSFPDEKKMECHLTPSLAGRIAKESGCKRLLLTHFYPICDQYDIQGECRKVYTGETILGEDRMRVRI